MEAVVARHYGGAEVISQEVMDQPKIAKDEVLLKVRAAALDRGVWHLMTGTPYVIRILGFGFSRPKQPVLGLDVSGEVVAVGRDVTRFSVGDELFGIGSATFAEFAAAPEKKLSHKPANLDLAAAASLGISGTTALQALTVHGNVQPGQSVLVIGASGGVGSFAVQIAVHLGAQVTAVASAEKAESVRALGALQVLNYFDPDYLASSEKYDLIIDAGGLNPLRKLMGALNPAGTLVIVGGEGGGKWTGGVGRNVRAIFLSAFSKKKLTAFISREDHAFTDQLATLVSIGTITPLIENRYHLSEASAAISDLEAGKVTGKALILVDEKSN